jgi:hypothetical protein
MDGYEGLAREIHLKKIPRDAAERIDYKDLIRQSIVQLLSFTRIVFKHAKVQFEVEAEEEKSFD